MKNNSVGVPRLRFSEFKNAPAWQEKKMEDLGFFRGGGTPSKKIDEYWKGSIPWVSSSDIGKNDIHNIKINRYINEKSIKESATKIIPKNSVLFVSRVGVGKLAINKIELCTSQDFTNFTPKKVGCYYLGYFFQANKNLLKNFNQGTSIKGFTKNNIENLKLHIPPSLEQQKIADCLTSLDELIDAQSQKVASLKQHKKGLMQQLFPQKDANTPQFRFPEFKNAPAWQEKKLEDVCDINPSNGNLPNRFVYIDLESVNSGSLSPKQEICKEFAPSRAQRILKNGDIIYQTVRPYQRNNLFCNFTNENKYVASTGYAQLRATCSNIFLYQLIHTDIFLQKVLAKCTGSNYPAIRSTDLSSINISLPCTENDKDIKEQQKIANCLTSLDELITAQSQKVASLKQHKKGLMQQLFPNNEQI